MIIYVTSEIHAFRALFVNRACIAYTNNPQQQHKIRKLAFELMNNTPSSDSLMVELSHLDALDTADESEALRVASAYLFDDDLLDALQKSRNTYSPESLAEKQLGMEHLHHYQVELNGEPHRGTIMEFNTPGLPFVFAGHPHKTLAIAEYNLMLTLKQEASGVRYDD